MTTGRMSFAGNKPRIQGIAGYFDGKRFAFSDKVTLGRNPEVCDIAFPLDAKGISGRHCELILRNGRVYITDCGSTYGTFVRDGLRLIPNQPVELSYGDEFWLGSEFEKFQLVKKQ